jgi:hypothetical protein
MAFSPNTLVKCQRKSKINANEALKVILFTKLRTEFLSWDFIWSLLHSCPQSKVTRGCLGTVDVSVSQSMSCRDRLQLAGFLPCPTCFSHTGSLEGPLTGRAAPGSSEVSVPGGRGTFYPPATETHVLLREFFKVEILWLYYFWTANSCWSSKNSVML